ELGAFYGDLLRGAEPAAPELPVQYADFAVWHRLWLETPAVREGLARWRRRLDGLPPLLELPLDRPRPAVQGHRGHTHPPSLGAQAVNALRRLGRQEGATLFMVLLAGFQALLGRSTGQEDFAVGSPVSGRSRREVEDLVGFFVNLIPL